MPPAVAVASDFLRCLERSRLLTPDELTAAIQTLGVSEGDAPVPVAKAFVKGGFLTRLQASRILEGNHRGFFIDHFRIQEILGSGGMGWVYIARDMNTGDDVALKLLTEENSRDPGLRTRFQLEAKAGSKLRHHAIVRTREIGHIAGLYGNIHYMVMDLVKGVGVDELVAMGGPVSWPLASHIVRYACAGLHHAHRHGLIHRDIKPANILVDEVSNSTILDFGLSLLSTGENDDEFSLAMIFGHDCLGTADFISPEQAVDSFNVDRRADIYSVGATMYYMLTGKAMFAQYKTRAEKIEAQQKLRPAPIRSLCPEMPERLAAILHTMIAPDREKRFRTAKAVCQMLEPFAQPGRIRFSFQKILERRYQIAVQRQKLIEQQAQQHTSPGVRKPPSAVETEIRSDTEVNRPKRGR